MRRTTLSFALLCAAGFSGLPAYAETEEAARLKKLEAAVAELQKQNAELKQAIEGATPAIPSAATSASGVTGALNKIKLGDSVTEVKLTGEGRLRYYLGQGEAAGLDGKDHGDRDRLRYRLKLGAELRMQDQWSLGFRLETSNSGRSQSVTLGENPSFGKETITKGDALTGVTGTSGPVVTGFDPLSGKVITGRAIGTVDSTKSSFVNNVNTGDTLFVGRAFLKYDAFPWLSIQGGKMANPFVTTRMVWDPDINPEGFAEQFRFSFGPTHPAGKDHAAAGPSLDLFANFGQFIYEDVGFENSFNNGNGPFATVPHRNDRWMLGWQLGARAKLNQDTYLQVAPALYHYTGGGNNSAGPFNGDSPIIVVNDKADPVLISFNQTGTNDLTFMDVPVEFGWKWGGVPMTLFGDYAYNFDAGQRAAAAGHPDKEEGTAYLFGASVGRTGHKGDWELRGWWQHTEQFALDQNIVDDDIFDGRLNMEGFYVQATYQFTDSISLIAQYSHGERIDRDLGTAGFGTLGTPVGFPLEKFNYFYIDLNLAF